MALTDEEKKKKLQQDISLDEWYNTNQQNIERQAQQQYEDAYVNRELMNKYLNQNLASQGLADTGIANLYAQQNNTDYMNQRANIANAQQEAENKLFNQYYTQKKAETDAYSQKLYDLYSGQIDNSVNPYGFIDEDARNKLSESIDWDSLNASDRSLLEAGLNMYVGTEEQLKNKAQYDAYEQFATDAGLIMRENENKYGETGLYYDQYEELLKQYNQAYTDGLISLEQKVELEDLLKDYKIDRKEVAGNDIAETKKQEIEKNTTDASIAADKKYLQDNLDSKYLKELNLDSPINIWDENLTSASFGNFARGGKENTNQSNYVKAIIEKARLGPENGGFQNGDTVRFNYGTTGLGNEGIYMYYNGKFYKYNNVWNAITPTYSFDANYGLAGLFSTNSTTPVKTKKGINLLNN